MEIPEEVAIRAIGKILSRKVKAYLKDPKHRAEFEAWYLKTYGVEWKDRPAPTPLNNQ